MKTATGSGIGLLRNLVLVSFSCFPCAIVFGRTAWPLYAIWVALAGVRVLYEDHKVLRDCLIFGIVTGLGMRHRIAEAVLTRWDEPTAGRRSLAVVSAITFVALAAFRYILGRDNHDQEVPRKYIPIGTHPWTMEHPKPFIIPCRTTHTRMFPKKHAFGYNYLLCGFPIVPGGTTLDGIDLPEGNDRILGHWWLHIRADDYLERGQASLGFYGKLKVYLREKVR